MTHDIWDIQRNQELYVISVGVLIIILVSVFGFRGKRPVECWFCQTKQSVKRCKVNSFICTTCSQYNGFDADGEYNIRRNSLSDERLNPSRFCLEKRNEKWENGLCLECNNRQEIRMKLLNDFMPLNDDNFDSEYKNYSRFLDELFSLCRTCMIHVDTEIMSKDLSFSSFQSLNFS